MGEDVSHWINSELHTGDRGEEEDDSEEEEEEEEEEDSEEEWHRIF